MAAGSAIDKLRVVVVSEEDDRERLYKLSPMMTVAEVVAVWIADEGTEDEWSVRVEGGATLKGAEHLVDVSEGKKGVHLYLERRPVVDTVEETATLLFSMFGKSGDAREIAVSLSITAEEIHPAVRKSFDIPDDRYFRLIKESGPLRYDLPLSEVDLPLTSPILVDLGYEVEVEDAWSGSVLSKGFVYASESLYDLLETTPRLMKRVYLGPLLLDTSRCLASSLPAHMAQLMIIRLIFEYQRCMTLHTEGKWKRHQVWPEERLEKVLPATSDQQCWRYDGQIVNRGQMFKEIGLQDQALLLQERPVLVQCSNGEGVMLWMPELSTVGHLREEVLKREADSEFCLKLGNRVLQLEEYVPQLSDFDNAVVVVRSENSFVIDLAGKEVKWTSRTGNMRFGRFCYELLQNANLTWNDLTEIEFRCNGCGRQIRRYEEEYQQLPADCCRVRSLRLSSYNPVEVKDRAAQGQSRSENSHAMREKKLGHRTSVQGGASQTRWKGVDVTTETSAGMGGRSACTQHTPLPPLSPKPFCLINSTSSGKGRFHGQYREVSLLLPSSPTAGQVTTAAAVELGLVPEEVMIGRLVGVSSGVVAVREGGKFFYTTKDGRKVAMKEVKDWKNEYWTIDDTALIFLPPGRRLYFAVYNNRPR